jgi:DNA-binding beta-propeller fold protein YncE
MRKLSESLTCKPDRILYMLVTVVVASFYIMITSCNKDDDPGEQKPVSKYLSADGVFIVNEGLFMAGNGDISFYNGKTKTVSNNLFYSINKRTPGDIPQYFTIFNGKGYLVVNNSNTVEVVDMNTFKVTRTIAGFEMPRQMLMYKDQLGKTRGLVSQLGSTKIAIVSLDSLAITGYIEAGKSTDRMVIIGQKLFVANWSEFYIPKPNNTITIFDLTTGLLTDSIVVTREPNSMVLDASGKLWVLCSGGYMGEETPALICIDPDQKTIVRTLPFNTPGSYPSLLTVSPDGNELCYADKDVFRMNIDDQTLSATPLIAAGSRYIYGLAMDPRNGEIYLTDAKDFQHEGMVYRYSNDALPIDSFGVGINPSGAFFYTK